MFAKLEDIAQIIDGTTIPAKIRRRLSEEERIVLECMLRSRTNVPRKNPAKIDDDEWGYQLEED